MEIQKDIAKERADKYSETYMEKFKEELQNDVVNIIFNRDAGWSKKLEDRISHSIDSSFRAGEEEMKKKVLEWAKKQESLAKFKRKQGLSESMDSFYYAVECTMDDLIGTVNSNK